ncbi:MAG: hypothetical protein HUU41_00740 [Bryobacteraceae bacterium]|nr:hypothetical protein [Bryobacterales bacterium]MEB2363074.1 hypothetical protein [Bryobacterales bacterium]NUM99613.1 hypothetical protein [Bryobacteraceae bacterium]
MFQSPNQLGRRAFLVAALGSGAITSYSAAQGHQTYVVVKPGTHPGIIFSPQELPALRRRARGAGLAAEAYTKVRRTAYESYPADLSVKQLVGREGNRLAGQLESMALVYQIEGDRDLARKAIRLFQSVASGCDPREFFRTVDSDFFATEHWPKAFAFAWDWLYPEISAGDRTTLIRNLETWSAALYEHTEAWWWRDASYNCGAIPVGANGLLLAAMQAESQHPDFRRWFNECFRKVKENYFPLTWRASGICNEGPGYAHYHKNPTQFADAVRRTGGPDIIGESGAVNAMHYLRHQWMPQGRCGTVGDNTEYGRRVFQAIYLHGIRELSDQPGLWTFERYADRERTEPFLQFLYYPDGLDPVSPGTLDLPTSFYFEIDRNRAGYLFARNEWDNEQASWFAFTTRYANANHTHYDMNSFVFTAFGEEFAAHTNIFPYQHPHHGADLEHNIVIVDDGGMPAADRPNSAGDDGSLYGYMTGVGVGRFGDYMRGDAHRSYADRSIKTDTPAVRADRTMVFAKQGANPYIVIADEIQRDDKEHNYHWQWYTMAHELSGRGTLDEPYLIEGRNARCKIVFLEPQAPEHKFRIVKSEQRRHGVDLGLLRVTVRGVQARYIALAASWRKEAPEPAVRRGPEVKGAAGAASFVVEGADFRDVIVWQPGTSGQPLTCGDVKTNGLMTVVRTASDGTVAGYILGDGASLRFADHTLVDAPRPLAVIADAKYLSAMGARRAHENLPPFAAAGTVWLPSPGAEVWADGTRVTPHKRNGGMAVI